MRNNVSILDFTLSRLLCFSYIGLSKFIIKMVGRQMKVCFLLRGSDVRLARSIDLAMWIRHECLQRV
jgi:hypothetical protein